MRAPQYTADAGRGASGYMLQWRPVQGIALSGQEQVVGSCASPLEAASMTRQFAVPRECTGNTTHHIADPESTTITSSAA